LKNGIIDIDFTYTGGVFSNVRGGEQRKTVYLGLAELGFTADTEKWGLWKNGTFHVCSFFAHGNPVTNYVGDYQDPVAFAYDIPAQVQEYWYKHRYFNDKATLKFGKQDTCRAFFVLPSEADFMNASFTCSPACHAETPPNTAWGISGSLKVPRGFVLKGGIHDADGDANKFWMSELKYLYYTAQIEKQYKLFGTLPGFVFVGGWYDSSKFELYDQSRTVRGVSGLAFGAEQTIWRRSICPRQKNMQEITFFTQFGMNQKNRRENVDGHLNIGLTSKGFWGARPEDVIGFACATAFFSQGYREEENRPYSYESAYELFYKIQVTERLMLQPNVQYIVQPDGQHTDATVLGMVFQVAF
jgi:porin